MSYGNYSFVTICLLLSPEDLISLLQKHIWSQGLCIGCSLCLEWCSPHPWLTNTLRSWMSGFREAITGFPKMIKSPFFAHVIELILSSPRYNFMWCVYLSFSCLPSTVLKTRSLKSVCRQGVGSLWKSWRSVFPCLSLILEPRAFLGLWLYCFNLCLCLHINFSVSVSSPPLLEMLFIYLRLCCVLVAVCGLCLVVGPGLLIAVASLVADHGL